MPMTKQQFLSEVKKRVPGYSDKELESGIMEFAQAHPDIEPEDALKVLDTFIAQNGAPAPKKSMARYLGEV